jgi:peptidoglycan/LPS O-acetylase OafA/YrhL
MPSPSRHLPALDGVRGLAILFVVLDHAAQLSPAPPGHLGQTFHDALLAGRMGVDLFFVLSGFLITGILLDARGEGPRGPRGYFTAFYARRVLRIFPIYYLLVIPFGTWWYWVFAENILVARAGWHAAPQTLTYMWSLAVEEQFYVIWPAIIAVLPRRSLKVLCLALIVGAPVLRLFLPPLAAYTLTIARADALAMGGLVALLVREDGNRYARQARALAAVAALGFALLLVTDGLAIPFGHMSLVAGSCTVALLAGATIYLLVLGHAPRWVTRAIEHPVLLSLGTYSYAMYLFHVPLSRLVAYWVSTHVSGTFPILLATSVGLLGVAWTAAWISWRVIERPILSLKRFVPMPSPGTVSPGTVSPGTASPGTASPGTASPGDDRQRDVGRMRPVVQDALVGDG